MTTLPFPRRTRRAGTFAATIAVAALAVAGCGSSSDSDSTSASTSASGSTAASTTAAAPAVTFTSSETKLPTSYPTPRQGDYTIGYLNPSSGQESLLAIQEGFTREAERYGARVTALDAKLSVDQQVSQFQTLIDQRVDAIAVYPLDPGALAPLVARAGRAGIPVVGIGVTLTPEQRADGFASQVWLGPDENGYVIAKAMAEQKPGAKVGVIGFAAPVPYIRTIVDRFEYWGRQLGLDVLGESDNRDDSISGGEAAATGLLGQHQDMDAIFAYNEDSALGAYSAVRSSGRQDDIAIFANNGATEGIDGVKSGKIAATFQFDALGTGALTADGALDAAAGTTIPPIVIVQEPRQIDPSNVDAAKNWDEQLKGGS